MKLAWIVITLFAQPLAAAAAEEKSSWTEVYDVGSAPQVVIDNIWGDIRIRPGPAGQVTVSASERRVAPNDQKLEASRDLIWLTVNAERQRVSLEVGGDERHFQSHRGCRGCRLEFRFDVQVPADASLSVATVNDGLIDVQGVTGTISAANVNGSVTVHDLHNCSAISSVNGPIELRFVAQPGQDCQLETINGDMTVNLPAGAGLDLAIELFNGRIVSAMDVQPVAEPARVRQTSDGSTTRYEIEKPVRLRLGRGGPRFELESLNGDVRLGISR